MNQKLYKKLELAGIGVVYLIAAFLHFLYPLSGESILGALLGAVNESLWEHIKIFAIAYLLWAAAELLWARPPVREFLPAKAAGLLVMGLAIVLPFYIYTFFLGKTLLAVDLLIGLAACVLGHFVSCRFTLSPYNRGQYFYTGIMLLILSFVMLLCFTYFPPESSLFRDPVTGLYGVPPTSLDTGAQVLDETYDL